jgi:hypothetical protein
LSSILVLAAIALTAAPYGMVYLHWSFDTTVFELPLVLCFVGGTATTLVGAISALGNVELVPNWQWRGELLVAIFAAGLLLNLVRIS